MQIIVQIIVFVAFIGLVGWTIFDKSGRTQLKAKSFEDWLLDSAGLFVQGMLIPLMQATIIYQLYRYWLPISPGYLHVSPILSFLISFVAVDYLYYWNHRLLHSTFFWNVHQVHHTVTNLDVLGTSRNTIWASFFIVYLWINSFFLYLFANSTGYLLGVSLTSVLDLWRHSQLIVPANSWFYHFLSPWLILPQDHSWHHSSQFPNCNYGANLKLWDRLHGTYYQNSELPTQIGNAIPLTFTQKLLFPFS
ncbi:MULTISPECIES: sterol desaturase family protein [Planktothrix]|uniref:Sterol desaturase n=1 Tax=Planktothrix rubescens CCAP 1459/22 TaxID=329571 RepID=A0A6J7ZES8_PLARU|nr:MULTISPECIES: sterol desaturase family protein [Planktothrix]CAC5339955.1 Sterol desaturase [Planktothrix rubescens NIVA-CYA 18]CAD5949476.1 C-5 sterol desaturase [Planktothrix rubescens NIVA-CYA 18]